MITFTLETDNAAFFDAPEYELRRAFDKAADIAINTPCGPNGFVRSVLDSNGNTCGKVTVTN